MVTIAELLDWRPDVIDALAEYFYDKRKIVLRLADEVHDARPPETWVGLGTVGAWRAYDIKRIELNDLAAQVSDLAVTLKETGNEVKGARDDLHSVLHLASGEGYTVNHKSAEITPPRISLPPDPRLKDPSLQQLDLDSRVAAVEKEQEARMAEFAELIGKALDRAEWADAGLAKAMEYVRAGKTKGGSGTIEEAVASQLPPSLDQLTPTQIATLFGDQIAVEAVMEYIEGNIPVNELLTLDFGGSAGYRVMQDGTVKMSLHVEAGVGVRLAEGQPLDGGIGAGGFTDFEIAFDSEEEAKAFLAGLDEAARDVTMVAGRPRLTGLGEYIAREHVTSSRVGGYGKGDFGFETPYVEGGVDGRGQGWYDEKNQEYGVSVEASIGGMAGHPETGVKAGASVGLSGEVKTDLHGKPKEVTLSGAITGEIANSKLGLNIPGVGAGGSGDVELKMNRDNVMWGEMNEALRKGDMSRAAEIAVDHGQVIFRSTAVATGDQDFGVAEAGGTSVETKQAWVRPANTREFVSVSPDVRPAG